MIRKAYTSIWDAIMDTPAESAKMKARSEMLMAIKATVAGWSMTQTAAAQKLGVTQPRLNDLLRGRISKFSTDTLFELSAAAGLEPTITVNSIRKTGRTSRAVGGAVKRARPRAEAVG